MEINRFFNELPIRILGTHEEPAFYANEIGKILGIKQTYRVIANFSSKQIVQAADRQRLGIKTYKIYKKRPAHEDPNLILLTEMGMYRLIMISKTQIAEQFRDWVFEVLKELRLRGKYEIQAELQRLETINEELLKQNNKLNTTVRNLIENQERFKQMTEKIYIIEYKNDQGLVKQRHVPKDELGEDYETDDDLLDVESDSEDDDFIRNLKILKRKDPECHNRVDKKLFNFPDEPEFTYKVAKEYTELDKIKGTVRYEAFVRNADKIITELDSQLAVYRLDSVEKVHYYNCDLGEIRTAAMMVITDAEGKY